MLTTKEILTREDVMEILKIGRSTLELPPEGTEDA